MKRTTNGIILTLLLSLFLLFSFSSAQKSYTITSIDSSIFITPDSGCSVSVIETFVYDFLGSYSTVARAIPYSIASASGLETSSLKVEVLTPGYTVSKLVSDQKDAKFIVVNMFPSTPAGISTRMMIRYSYSLSGPIRQYGGSNQVTYYYKEGTEIANLNATFHFHSTIDFEGDLMPSTGGIVEGNSVYFQKESIRPNTAFQPSVSFETISGEFNQCSGPDIGLGTIISIIVGVGVFICISLVCGFTGLFRRYGWRRSSYGYISSGNHHHHHSGGSRGITGTSGFAN